MNAKAGGNASLEPTEADAATLRLLLIDALGASDDPDIRSLADDIRDTAAWVDNSGAVYVGQWRLDNQKQRFVNRPLRARNGPVFEADVSHDGTEWSVGPISVGRQVAPRF